MPPAGDGEGALVERDDELAALAHAVEEVSTAGRLLIIEGPAGIGKTQLVESVVRLARGRGVSALSARGAEFEQQFAFGVARQLFERRIIRAAPRERRLLLAGAAGLAAGALGLEEQPQHPIEPSFGAVHGLYWLVSNLALAAPLLIAIDDAHWADAATLGVLQYLARRLQDLRVLLVLAHRPREPGAHRDLLDALTGEHGARVLSPRPLTRAGAGRMLAVEIGHQPAEELVSTCHAQTGGNPFLLHELGLTLRAEGAASVAAFAVDPPEAVSRSILLRIGRLGPDAVSLAQASAILDDGAEPAESTALAELEPSASAVAAEALIHAEILTADASRAFVHPLVRAVVLADLTHPMRAQWHHRAAAMLRVRGAAVERIAAHLLNSEPAGDPLSAECLRVTARSAAARGAPQSARLLLERALREPPDDDAIGDVLAELGLSELMVGDSRAAVGHLGRSCELARGPDARTARVSALARATLGAEGPAAAARLLERELDAAGSQPREVRLGLEAELAAMAVFDAAGSARLWRRLDQFAELAGETPAERRILAITAVRHQYEGRVPAAEVRAAAVRAAAGGDLVAAGATEALYWAYAMSALASVDAVDEVEALVESAREHARATGWIDGFAVAASGVCLARLRGGRLLETEDEGGTVLELLDELEPQPVRVIVRNAAAQWIAESRIERGDLDGAQEMLERHGLDAARDVQTVNGAYARALLHLARRAPRRALEDLARKQEVEAASGWIEPGTPWRAAAVLAHVRLDELELARALAEQQLEIATRWGQPRELAAALRASALVERGARRVELLSDAVDCLEGSTAQLERAKSLTALGLALRAGGRRSLAKEHLMRAAEGATRCGATPLAEQAAAELRVLGARPRRLMFSGVESLTASERRIAELAGAGATNREIAQELFVTVKTVESHLSQVFGKLDVSSREQLAGALAD